MNKVDENEAFSNSPSEVNNRIYNFRVQPQDVDFQYNITLAGLTNFLLTTAGLNADENEFGIRNLNELKCTWVLLRLTVQMDRFPQQYEKLRIETWVENVGRASTTRNFRIRNIQNEIIGIATSNWAMISIETRKAQDLHLLQGLTQKATGEKLNISKPEKQMSIASNPVDIFTVKYSHIDINGHVSSTRYVEWISNAVDLDVYRKMKISRFEISFLNEIYYGDKISVLAFNTDTDEFYFEIKSASKTSCRAKIVFTPKTSKN